MVFKLVLGDTRTESGYDDLVKCSGRLHIMSKLSLSLEIL